MLNATITTCLAIALSTAPAIAGTSLPDFGAATFVDGAAIDNTFFPLLPGTIRTYSANLDDGEGGTDLIVIEDFVTFDTRIVNGVTAVVVRAREWENGLLTEDTDDWYAQDTVGNVWYLGEFSTAFEYDDDDNLIGSNTHGSWEAGIDGALPGYIMPANPQVGDAYFQEFAPGADAVDEAEITSLTRSFSIAFGDFDNALETLEFTTLEPDVTENKIYVQGIGLTLIEEDLDEFGVPGAVIPLVSVETVPEPGTAALVFAGALWFVRRRRPQA